jgi:hypothetical protein
MTRNPQTVGATMTINAVLRQSPENDRINNRNVILMSFAIYLTIKTA